MSCGFNEVESKTVIIKSSMMIAGYNSRPVRTQGRERK